MSAKSVQKQQRRRSEIIETAIRLIGDTPFKDLSVADICEAADISIGSFYHYFEKKADLLVGFFSLIDEYMVTEVFPLLTDENELENLKTFAHGWAFHINDNGIERSKLITSIEPSDLDLSGSLRPSKVRLCEILSSGQQKGQIITTCSTETLADYFLMAMRGVSADWSRHNNQYDLIKKMDDFIDLFVDSLSTHR